MFSLEPNVLASLVRQPFHALPGPLFGSAPLPHLGIRFKVIINENDLEMASWQDFWDTEGVILIDWLDPGAIGNSAVYVAALRKLCCAIQKKRSGKWVVCSCIMTMVVPM